jgi:hypothetical protein
MAAWSFKTATRQSRDSFAHQWYWQIDAQHALLTSTRLFATLEDCVADAQKNGFRGAVDRDSVYAHPAVIVAGEADDVEALVRRA